MADTTDLIIHQADSSPEFRRRKNERKLDTYAEKKQIQDIMKIGFFHESLQHNFKIRSHNRFLSPKLHGVLFYFQEKRKFVTYSRFSEKKEAADFGIQILLSCK